MAATHTAPVIFLLEKMLPKNRPAATDSAVDGSRRDRRLPAHGIDAQRGRPAVELSDLDDLDVRGDGPARRR